MANGPGSVGRVIPDSATGESLFDSRLTMGWAETAVGGGGMGSSGGGGV